MTVAAVIPVKNEDWAELADLSRVLTEQHGCTVYVVDDSEPRIPVYHGWALDGEGSLGASLEAGLDEALDAGAERIVVIDCGGSHHPAELWRMLNTDADVVIGSRFVKGGRHFGPRWRRIASRWYSLLLTVSTGNGVADWTSGYRVYTRRAAGTILTAGVECQGHAWQAEALLAVIDRGGKVVEVPIDYAVSDSSFGWRSFREAIGFLVRVWRR